MLRPDVSPRLAGIVARALATDPADRFLSMREFAAELSGVRELTVTTALEPFADARQDTQQFAVQDLDEAAADGAGTAVPAKPRPTRARREPRETRRPRTGREMRARILAWSMVGAPLVALVIFGIMIAGERGTDQVGSKERGATGPARPIAVASVAAFDPAPGDGDEHSDTKDNVLDGDPETTWGTDGYDTRDFNRLKPGVGLMLQLEQDADVRDVQIETTLPGWTMEVRVADSPVGELDGWKPVSKAVAINDGMKVPVDLDGEKTRYVLLWITKLVIDTDDPNRARARIGEIRVFGNPAGS